MKKQTVSKVMFIFVFVFLGFLSMRVPFSRIVGAENLKFSLFDFYGPIAGSFVGSVFGLLAVGAMQVFGWIYNGFPTDVGSLIRLFPMLFAVLYFSKKSGWTLIVPAVAIIAFWIHPEGRIAWYYALYWLIPIVMYFFHDKFIFARALGTTFTAHCVGSTLFLWGMNLKAEVWIGLIPIVWKERMLMAIGITLTYIAFNYLMSFVQEKTELRLPFVKLNPKYTLRHEIKAQ